MEFLLRSMDRYSKRIVFFAMIAGTLSSITKSGDALNAIETTQHMKKNVHGIRKAIKQIKMIKNKIIPLIFLVVFVVFMRLEASNVADILKTIPKDHQEDLRYLFRMIFLEQDGAYTVFGDKPVSLAGGFLIPPWKSLINGRCVGKLGCAWKTWQKYKHKFPMQQYVILGELCKFENPESVTLNIFVINKRAFIESIRNHIMFFESVLGDKVDPESFLKDLEDERISFWTSIHHNEMLLGILLGYGKHNASFFNHRARHCHQVPMIMSGTKSKYTVLNSSNRNIYPMMIVNPVQFLADLEHPETKRLQMGYKNSRKMISSIYSQGDFLEITLTRLISE